MIGIWLLSPRGFKPRTDEGTYTITIIQRVFCKFCIIDKNTGWWENDKCEHYLKLCVVLCCWVCCFYGYSLSLFYSSELKAAQIYMQITLKFMDTVMPQMTANACVRDIQGTLNFPIAVSNRPWCNSLTLHHPLHLSFATEPSPWFIDIVSSSRNQCDLSLSCCCYLRAS